ncbi:uncharacterized protein LOC100898201 [Galendromus occidentalis]|uniref:Uncharacterized protein LOC100898201 n=1 Tax=Galendromus occidentalis TaxID=34638 RepID=A0AAJ6QNQ6_9ACAR|nr:uncharacterized protein LOC100898201 [Galendromus occidentalis]
MNQLPKGLSYVNGRLNFSDFPVSGIAEAHGTPTYVYSETVLDDCLAQFPLNRPGVSVCYAVKANNNLSILEHLRKNGAFFEVASSEELRRVSTATNQEVLRNCVATGPAKSVNFLKDCLSNNVFSIHAESEEELERIEILRQKFPESSTKVALRINFDTSGEAGRSSLPTGASSDKFGVAPAEALRLAERFHIEGLHYHVGSCVLDEEVLYEARDHALDLVEEFESKGLNIAYVDVGGSFGIPYVETQAPLNIPLVIDRIATPFLNKDIHVFIEPGRSVIAQSGILVTRVEYIKSTPLKNFALVDAGMNDLVRPALYGSFHRILTEFEPPINPEKKSTEMTIADSPVSPTSDRVLRASESFRLAENSKPVPSPRLSRRVDSMPPDLRGSRESFDDLLNELQGNRLFKRTYAPVPSPRTVRRSSLEGPVKYDIVGPVCESADSLGLSRTLPRLRMADLLIITDVGAYGYSMASNYNSRNKPAQVMILSNGGVKLISRRQMLEDQLMLERNLDSFAHS